MSISSTHPERFRLVEHLWLQAMEEPPESRFEWLEQQKLSDHELVDQVASLLRAGEEVGDRFEDWIDRAALSLDSFESYIPVRFEPALSPGTSWGYVRIEELIGAGGMGKVYRGKDERLGREVALKILHPEYSADDEMTVRLVREARWLAELKHPTLRQIYDVIEEPTGTALVLEWIPGQTLREVLKDGVDRQTALRWTLALAEGLTAAHGAGIVHRDLKPGNVMVTPDDEVKLLDFGIAHQITFPADGSFFRSNSKRPPHSSSITSPGAVLGTPRYMSPEQARGERVSPASDVYALGLLLHEMLSGGPVFTTHLTSAEIDRRVQAGDVPPVEDRDPELVTLMRSLTAEKAGLRPSSVDAAERLRYLIAAPSRQRRRMLLSGAFLVLFLFSLVTSWQAWRISKEAERANSAAEQAQKEAATAERATTFLVDLFDASNPFTTETSENGREITAREMLLAGLERFDRDLEKEPEVQARLLMAGSRAAFGLGMLAEAQSTAERSLEIRRTIHRDDHLDIAESLSQIGIVQYMRGEMNAGLVDLNASLAIVERLKADPQIWWGSLFNNLALIHERLGEFDRAERFARQALATRVTFRRVDKPGRVGESQATLGMVLHSISRRGEPSRLEEARRMYELALAHQRQELDPSHPDIAWTLTLLGDATMDTGDFEKADPFFREALALTINRLGEDHFETARVRLLLADNQRRAGRLDSAHEEFVTVLQAYERLYGPESMRLIRPLHAFALLDLARGRLQIAETRLERAATIATEHFPDGHFSREYIHISQAMVLRDQGLFTQAGRQLLQVIDRQQEGRYPGILDKANELLAELPTNQEED